MAALLRNASPALIGALSSGIPLARADMFKFVLVDGVTTYYWTSWEKDLVYLGNTYISKRPWLNAGKWNVTNTMTIPNLSVKLMALNDSFNGGASLKKQIHAGLFTGATFLMSRAYMTMADAVIGNTAYLGGVDLFGGVVGAIDMIGTTCTITIKGKNNKLNQYGPRATYQQGCNHAFCDAGCTLNRAAYTATYSVGASPTAIFLPWAVAPASPSNYISGTAHITTGPGAGQQRTIVAADATGVTLIYPLFELPNPGDTFTAFQGCDKTYNSGSGQSCTDRANTNNYDGFEFVPPPTSTY